VAGLGVVSFPLWIVGSIRGELQGESWLAQPYPESGLAPAAGLWLLGVSALVVFVGLLFRTQPAQRLRRQVEGLLQAKEITDALTLMSAHTPADFPPHWEPPPLSHFREPPGLLDILDVLADGKPAAWVRAAYLERFGEYLKDPVWYWFYDVDLERIAALLRR